MSTFTASIETYDNGTFQYGFHLGTCERTARECVKSLMGLRYHSRLGRIRVATVALMRDGRMVDCFDGDDWQSEMLDQMYAEELDREYRAEARYHA